MVFIVTKRSSCIGRKNFRGRDGCKKNPFIRKKNRAPGKRRRTNGTGKRTDQSGKARGTLLTCWFRIGVLKAGTGFLSRIGSGKRKMGQNEKAKRVPTRERIMNLINFPRRRDRRVSAKEEPKKRIASKRGDTGKKDFKGKGI